MEKLKNTRLLAAIGIVCLFLGNFLPYFKVSFLTYSYQLTLGKYLEGKIILALIMANLLFIFKDYVERYVPQLFHSAIGKKVKNANPKLAILPTILIAILAIWLSMHVELDQDYLKYGIGFYLLWIGILCCLGHAIFYQKRKKEQEVSSYGNMNPNNIGVTANVKYCQGCGNPSEVSAERCFMCGRMF